MAGFVLRGDPLLEDHQLVRGIRDAVPGDTGRQLAEQVDGAVDSAGTFGLVGLAGFLLVGLGAMDELRVGMDVVCAAARTRPTSWATGSRTSARCWGRASPVR